MPALRAEAKIVKRVTDALVKKPGRGAKGIIVGREGFSPPKNLHPSAS
jgi:hypothetical protein